jgi:chitin synthase
LENCQLAIKAILELSLSNPGKKGTKLFTQIHLEQNHIAGALSGERNFDIFYYLIASVSAEEHQHLKLAKKATY